MVNPAYATERLNAENFRSFTEVFRASFPNSQYSDAYFRDKFDTRHSEHLFYGHLAFEKETHNPAAYFGVFPVFAAWGEKTLLAGQSGDVATHPDHRQKGLFRILHDATLGLCAADSFDFLFAFPNANSLPGFLKAGWQTGQAVETWIKRLPTSFYVRLLRKLLPGKFAERQGKMLDARSVQPNAEIAGLPGLAVSFSGNSIRLTRSVAYLNYKNRLGSKIIRLTHGYAWVAFKGNQLLICDLFGEPQNDLLHELSLWAASAGFDFLVFTSNISRCNAWLHSHGFTKRREITLTVQPMRTPIEARSLMITGVTLSCR